MNKNALFYGVALIAASSFISCKSMKAVLPSVRLLRRRCDLRTRG